MKDEKLEARPTWFESTLYRSQIEARWALFFKCMDIEAKYEERYFDLDDGIFYTPDFWLAKQNCWFEVQGAFPAKDKIEKARRLAIYTKTTGLYFPRTNTRTRPRSRILVCNQCSRVFPGRQ